MHISIYSIKGYCDSNADFTSIKLSFDKTISQGPYDSRIIDTGKGFLGIIIYVL